jgi:alkylated DNA nucleotide flippase Atl1
MRREFVALFVARTGIVNRVIGDPISARVGGRIHRSATPDRDHAVHRVERRPDHGREQGADRMAHGAAEVAPAPAT